MRSQQHPSFEILPHAHKVAINSSLGAYFSMSSFTPPMPRAPPLLQVLFTMLADGTMAAEVEMWRTLVQWPFLADMSLVSAIVGIFVPTWCTGPAPLANTLLMRANPWFYFNLVMKKSQVGPVGSALCSLLMAVLASTLLG